MAADVKEGGQSLRGTGCRPVAPVRAAVAVRSYGRRRLAPKLRRLHAVRTAMTDSPPISRVTKLPRLVEFLQASSTHPHPREDALHLFLEHGRVGVQPPL